MVNSLYFCLSENVFISFMEDIFAFLVVLSAMVGPYYPAYHYSPSDFYIWLHLLLLSIQSYLMLCRTCFMMTYQSIIDNILLSLSSCKVALYLGISF